MGGALGEALDDFADDLDAIAALIDPLALEPPIAEVFDAVRAQVDALDPTTLLSDLRTEVYLPITQAIAALDPAELAARLDAAYTKARTGVLDEFRGLVDAITRAVNEHLAGVRRAVQDLLGRLETALAGATQDVQDVVKRVSDLVFVDLVQQSAAGPRQPPAQLRHGAATDRPSLRRDARRRADRPPDPAGILDHAGGCGMTELLERIAGCVRPELAPDVRLDQGGRVAEVADGDRTLRYGYDAHGDLVAVDDSRLGESRFVYDEHRRLVQACHPGQVAGYRYDQDDRLVEVESEGHRMLAGYDTAGRLTAVRHDDDVLQTYRYDDAGRVVEGRDGGVVTRYTYDDDGRAVRVEQLVDGVAAVVNIHYDLHGRRCEVVPVGGPRIGYAWDGSGRPAAITVDGHVAVEVGYDDEHRLVRTRLANGLVEEARADPTDGRTVERVLRRDGLTLLHRRYAMTPPAGSSMTGTAVTATTSSPG